jgi:hypothetical protein
MQELFLDREEVWENRKSQITHVRPKYRLTLNKAVGAVKKVEKTKLSRSSSSSHYDWKVRSNLLIP